MRRATWILLLVLAVYGWGNYASAQEFTGREHRGLIRSVTVTLSVKPLVKGLTVDQQAIVGNMTWPNLNRKPRPEKLGVYFAGTVKEGVYYIRRTLHKGQIEAFGFGKGFLDAVTKAGHKVAITEPIDYKFPYVFRKVKGGYEASPYTDTVELPRLFEVTNLFLYNELIPHLKNQAAAPVDKDGLALGDVLTFEGRKYWRWEN
jgi:hypothetical protein